jgi:hypothetical protein
VAEARRNLKLAETELEKLEAKALPDNFLDQSQTKRDEAKQNLDNADFALQSAGKALQSAQTTLASLQSVVLEGAAKVAADQEENQLRDKVKLLETDKELKTSQKDTKQAALKVVDAALAAAKILTKALDDARLAKHALEEAGKDEEVARVRAGFCSARVAGYNWGAIGAVVAALAVLVGLGQHFHGQYENGKREEEKKEEDEKRQTSLYNEMLALRGLLRDFEDTNLEHACDHYVPRPDFEATVRKYFGAAGYHFLVVMGGKEAGKSSLLHYLACQQGNGKRWSRVRVGIGVFRGARLQRFLCVCSCRSCSGDDGR